MNSRDTQWKPNVTVAAVIERDGRFLLVEEHTSQGIRYNQPAGHLESGESLLDAVRRETLEETAWSFEPEHLLGIYQYAHPGDAVTYLRFAFTGRLLSHDDGRQLDDGIIRIVWMTPEEIDACVDRHRSPLLTRCVEDYRSGQRHPLSLLFHESPS